VNEQRQGHTPPDDPWNISLSYRREHCWWYSADDALVTWHVSADIDDVSGPDAGSHVGDMSITLVDIYETSDPFALLDGEDAELGHIAGTIFDPGDGQLDPDLDEQLEPVGSQILILHSVRLTLPWRGFGLGALRQRGDGTADPARPAAQAGPAEPGHFSASVPAHAG
jgi:hypothetical protein